MSMVTDKLDELDRLDVDEGRVDPSTDAGPTPPAGAGGAGSDRPAGADERPEPRATMVAAAAVLSTGAAAWLIGSMFHGAWLPRLLGLAGVAVGAGLTWLSVSGTRRPFLQAAVIPAAVVAGAVLVAPSATGGTANLPSLVGEALRGGGLLQPPIPFEPGWRFIVVVLFAVTSAAAVGLAMALRRSRLSVLVPMPLLIGAAILQPGDNLGDPVVAGMLAIAGLAVAFGADTPDGDGTRARFEIRRLVRGAGLLAVLGAVLVVVARAGFLFPDQPDNRVIPPQRPPSPPAEPDRVIFTAQGDTRGPFRVGVLDGYDGEAFLLPPIDPERAGDIAALTPPRAAEASDERLTVRFTIEDMRGSTLPLPAAPVSIDRSESLEADPRTQVVRLTSGRPPSGYTYEVTSLIPPSGEQLATAPAVTAPAVEAFAEAPPAPNEVVTALAEAPESGFDRIQFLRQRLYNSVVAAGEGSPDPVPPARVGEMLRPGTEATPFEITAAEVLLARWAGVPARLGFGYYGGEANGDVTEFRPRHGAAWLEVYFEGYGWVPLVGTPPRAKSSLSDSLKNDSPETMAAQDLAMVVFVPVRRTAIELLYQQARYWLALLTPVGLLAGAVMAGWVPVLKLVRRFQRQRWAARSGPRERIWTAYAEFRDRATDLGIGTPTPPPLEFTETIDADAEHDELAWLVTRAMWGDLQRDLHDADADAAEELARSVSRRVTGALPFIMRAAAAMSKSSLREPFAPELPGRRLRDPHRRAAPSGLLSRVRHVVVRPATAFAATLVVTIALAPVLFPVSEASARLPVALPERVIPDSVGRFTVTREPETEANFAVPGSDSLAVAGRVHTFRADALVAGSHQLVVLADNVDTSDRATQRRLESNILNGAFTTRWYGTTRVRELHTAEQQVFVWFPPTVNVMELWVFRADVDDARATVERTIAFQLNLPHRDPGGRR